MTVKQYGDVVEARWRRDNPRYSVRAANTALGGRWGLEKPFVKPEQLWDAVEEMLALGTRVFVWRNGALLLDSAGMGIERRTT